MSDIPYMPSTGNLPSILQKIRVAQTPPRFTHEFLKKQLGFSSSNDRAVVKVLKQLGFLTSDSRPTDRYNQFRGESGQSPALAEGLKEGWASVFLADQEAYNRSQSQLEEIFKNVTGKSESVSKKLARTFKVLSEQADFSSSAEASSDESVEDVLDPRGGNAVPREPAPPGGRGVSLHNDIHVHLPATSDVAVYTAIFRALREELVD